MNEGLRHLSVQADRNGAKLLDSSKVVLIPLHSFLDQLITSLRKYLAAPHSSSWAEHIVLTSNDKNFSNIYGSWIKYNPKSLEAQLLSTLLPCGSIPKLSTFLRLRKLTLKTSTKNNPMLDDISLQHEDIIGIIHSMHADPDSRKLLTNGIKNLFMSYKMQQAKY